MKKSFKRILAVAVTGCLCLPTLTGCSRMFEQAGIYFDSLVTVITNQIKYNEVMNGDNSTPKRENALPTPENFAVQEDGAYSFDAVDGANYYVVSVYESAGALDSVGSKTIQADSNTTYTGTMSELKREYTYGDWYVRVVAYPEDGGEKEESDAAFTTYTVKGAVTNGTISNQYMWDAYTGKLAITLKGFDYGKTAYPTNVKVTLTNQSTQDTFTADTGKLTASSTQVEVEVGKTTADYVVSLDCTWDDKYVTNPSWSTTAGNISVSKEKSSMSSGLSYTCGIFNKFEFPFVYEGGFKPTDVPTDKKYAEVALTDGIVFGTSTAGNNTCTFRAYPLWTEKGYKAKEGAIYSFDVRIKGTSSITASPRKSPGSGSTNIIFGQLDFFADGTFELELEYQYMKTDQMNAGVYYVPGVICEGIYHVESDDTYTLSFSYSTAYETNYQPVEELNGRASYYSEVDSSWKGSSGGNNSN